MRNTTLRLPLLVALLVFVGTAWTFPAAQQRPLFAFHSNAWLNLHHFVRAAARGGGPGGAGAPELSNDDRARWLAGVESYKPYAQRDLLFDDGMVAIKNALRGGESTASLDRIAIDAELKGTLERVMPVYQKYWWPAHDRSNREWIAALQPLLDRHGAAISQALVRTYGVSWPPQPIDVDVSFLAGPVGAYTTEGHVMVPSSDASIRGYRALEIIFHESSHTLGLFPVLIQPLNRAAAEQSIKVPPQLWHAVLFYTAGELTTRELKANGIEYTEYAGTGPDGLYRNLCGGCRDKIVEHWGPHLEGTRSIPDALAALVAAFKP